MTCLIVLNQQFSYKVQNFDFLNEFQHAKSQNFHDKIEPKLHSTLN